MQANSSSIHWHKSRVIVALLVALTLAVTAFAFTSAKTVPSPTMGTQSPFYSLGLTLNDGASISPTYNQSGISRDFNFSLTVTGAAPIELTITNSNSQTVWTGQAEPGEVLWGTGALTGGINQLEITNLGGGSATFALQLYDLPDTPELWSGSADPAGLNSHARLNFTQSGLYTFNFGVTANERYEFQVDTDYIQKTVVGPTSATYYVEAGVHDLYIVQETTSNDVDWDVDISFGGLPGDPLPYQKEGTDINQEFLPLFLEDPAQVNLVITATGTLSDSLALDVFNPDGQPIAGGSHVVEAGERFWATFDLPAGANLIQLAANNGVMGYGLTIDTVPDSDGYMWAGEADATGENSHIRLDFAEDGLYQFGFGEGGSGRYQFQLNSNSDDYIQKTIEATDMVTYFVPAGTHDLYIDQDTGTGSDWAVAVTQVSTGADSLPYSKMGGNLGGVDNDFTDEWLPISLEESTDVNLDITAFGNAGDSLMVEVYEAGSSTANFTLAQVLGTETTWATFSLSAGMNRLRVIADGANTDSMSYELNVSAIPNETAMWAGNTLNAGLNSVITVNFPTSGLYRFSLNSTEGFANLILDDAMATLFAPEGATEIDATYDIEVTAGNHEVYIVQDPAFPFTNWTASIEPAPVAENFLTVDAVLTTDEVVTQEFFVPTGEQEFNFSVTATGGDLDVSIMDGATAVVWQESIIDGETVWGTGTFSGINQIMLTQTNGGNTNVDLDFYYMPTAAYDWAGVANATGVDSHIRLNFAESGLYTFDLTANTGRFQFLVNSDYIQKTVEDASSVTYYIPAGVHDLYIIQDTTVGSDWSLAISDVIAPLDTLPYSKSGGDIGGVDNDFTEEWLPVQLAEDTLVNLVITASGNTDDMMMLEVLDGSGQTASLTPIFGSESIWMTTELPANGRLHIVADSGNTGAMGYEVSIHPIPTPAHTVSGSSLGANPVNSHVRVDFPESGLYTFDLGVANGRYQLEVNNEYILKTAENDTSVTYYIPAGMHDFYVNQDSAQGADWSLAISQLGDALDTLPYMKNGGNIGGTANDFDHEWLPVELGAETMVNVVITLTGVTTDSLSLHVWDTLSNTFTVEPLYGSEVVWATTTLPASARLQLVADGGNLSNMGYELAVYPIPEPTYEWSGVSRGEGVNPTIQLFTPANGLYRVEIFLTEGFIDFGGIDMALANVEGGGADITFDVPLEAGLHTFTGRQETSFETNSWRVRVSLLSASAPLVYGVEPNEQLVGTSQTIVITGFNFIDPVVQVELEGTLYDLQVVSVENGNTITAVTPDTLPIGLYDVIVTNDDTQTARLVDVYTVFEYKLYLPFVTTP